MKVDDISIDNTFVNFNLITKQLTRFNQKLGKIQDTSILYERILNVSKNFVNADSCAIYLNEVNGLELAFLRASNNEDDGYISNKTFTTEVITIENTHHIGYATLEQDIIMANLCDSEDLPYQFKMFLPEADQLSIGEVENFLVLPIISSTTNKVIAVVEFLNMRDRKTSDIMLPDSQTLLVLKMATLIASATITRATITYNSIMRMIQLVQLRDPRETGNHINRVADFSLELLEQYVKRYHIDRSILLENKDILHLGAMLHDIGKVGIPDNILKKEGKLTEEEFNEMKNHPMIGADLFVDKSEDFDKITYEIVLNHHENWDGSGYNGLIGNDKFYGHLNLNNSPETESDIYIPFSAQIVALADVFDALFTKRAYKDAWTIEEVVKEINRLSGKKFNPKLVEVFNLSLPRLISIMHFYKRNTYY